MSQANISEEEKARLFRTLDELQRLAKVQTELLRVLVHHKYEKAVSSILRSKRERLVYEYSDGSRASRDVAEMAGVSQATVKRWWKDWADKGLGKRSRRVQGGKRFEASYTLLELALALLQGEVTPH
jgi:DNA-binding MarR family transcriptional regulator